MGLIDYAGLLRRGSGEHSSLRARYTGVSVLFSQKKRRQRFSRG